MSRVGDFFDNEESRSFDAIRAAATDAERRRLISEFESVPVRFSPFYRRWLHIHDVYSLNGWSDGGYESDTSAIPRDIQLLEATSYGVSDIENGGLHQFLYNPTGVFAPEMIEWFNRAGLPETAAILSEAIAVFGTVYPRSQAQRHEVLDSVPGAYEGPRANWDPFTSMDKRFYASLPDGRFHEFADRWLRETCGIQELTDPPSRASSGNC